MKILALLISVASTLAFAKIRPNLINGQPVDPGTYKEVVYINTDSGWCTATIVGPRAIITAAHCVESRAVTKFKFNGKDYTANSVMSSLYPAKDHDLAVVYTSQDIEGAVPATIGGKATVGLGVTILGYGCLDAGGKSGNDGILRVGDSVVSGFSNFDMETKKAGGAVLCFGDSGGPVFTKVGNDRVLLGINSKGNIRTYSLHARTDMPESQNFLKQVAQAQGLSICGINMNCGTVNPPPPGAPTCTLTATPPQIEVGETLRVSIVGQGQVDTGEINGQTVAVPGEISIRGTEAGSFVARGSVKGPGGTGNCEANYVVKDKGNPPPPPPPPTGISCEIAAIPSHVTLGSSVTLELTAKGHVTAAEIDGMTVNVPLGKRVVTPLTTGNRTSVGTVAGEGKTASCTVTYSVEEGSTPPPPDTANLAVVSAYCGANAVPESGVKRACLAVIKKDSSLQGLTVSTAILLENADTTQEVMPLFSRRELTRDSDGLYKEEMTFYANGIIQGPGYPILDSRRATLKSTSKGGVPVTIEGRSTSGRYFSVSQFNPS